jgi:putative hydrolase of the HAD superfamily
MPIEAVLFDADGVIQSRPGGWRGTLDRALGFEGSCADFLKDVYAAEVPSLAGGQNFADSLSDLLAKWACRASLNDALRVWTTITCQTPVLDVVERLRREGVLCCIASNQEPYKATYMSQVLGYAELFDKEFYSCHLGRVKPSADYFQAILDDIALAPGHVLFIDDQERNVDGAMEVGMQGAVFNSGAGAERLISLLRRFKLLVGPEDAGVSF